MVLGKEVVDLSNLISLPAADIKMLCFWNTNLTDPIDLWLFDGLDTIATNN